MVEWRLAALVCSVAYGLQMVVIKSLTRRGFRTVRVLWYTMAASVPVLLGFLLATAPHVYSGQFPLVLILAVTGNLVGFYGFVRALELSDVSLVSPLLSLSPLFMLLTSWLMLSEFPDGRGLLGIIAVSVGTYYLAKDPDMEGWEPILRLWENRGVRWALAVSLVWSVTANIDKMAVQRATPIGYSFWFHVSFAVVFLPVYFYVSRTGEKDVREISWTRGGMLVAAGLLTTGVLQALLSGSQMYAIMETDVAYIIALKRAGMLISVLGGGLLLGEQHLRRRLWSSGIVFLGLLGIIFR